MSAHQYVYFAALDRPLNDEQLAYMQRQSSRASVTRWQFENEYHYGDFHGDAKEMLRRGYDVHLHFANFGIRKLMFRFPQGLPGGMRQLKPYLSYGPDWIKDLRGKGGILSIQPESDAGTYESHYSGFSGLTESLPAIRESLTSGDLRPLYLAWLACAGGDTEPPVPGGLRSLPHELEKLAEFYKLPDDLMDAAAQESPDAPKQQDQKKLQKKLVDAWLAERAPQELKRLLRRVLEGDGQHVRTESLAAIRQEHGLAAWPTAAPRRTWEQIQSLASEAYDDRRRREEQAQERARQEHLKTIAARPAQAVKKAEKLVKTRSTDNYRKAAAILAELREAMGPDKGPARADAAAKKVVNAHPTLHAMKKALREQGLSYR